MGPAAVGASNIAPGAITTTQISPSAAITNAQLANSSITINGNAVSLGGSITAGTDWQAVTVADGSTTLNAVAGKGYFLDTNAGVIEVFLPTSPTRGDTIVIADYGNNFATNRVIINTGGKLIDSTVGGEPGSSGFTINTNGAVVELVFADDTAGWIVKQNNVPSDLGADAYGLYITATGGTITTSGDFKIHTFTGDGCFVVSSVGNPAGSDSVDYLVVAGGGGAGQDIGGGGGAGGFRYSASTYCSPTCAPGHPLRSPTGLPVSATTYPITVGGGGTSAPSIPVKATDGSSSIFSTITSTGGGAGGSSSGPTGDGNSGGSGGGSGNDTGGARVGGSGNTPPTSPPQGNPGGGPTSVIAGGGGGGAIAAGSPSLPGCGGGPGGAGAGLPIAFGTSGENCGSYYYFSGGGGGGARTPAYGPAGSGGIGGGGDGVQTGAGNAGTANTGGGAGGPSGNSVVTAGAGGKGIVIIRYKFQN
jgi:hypothetical protein